MRAGKVFRGLAAALVAVASTGLTPGASVPAPAVSSGVPDADTIFRNVRNAWADGAYPRYATYATVVDYHNGTRHVRRTWDSTEDFRHDLVYSRKFAREELAHPKVPHGTSVSILFFQINPEQSDDPIGHLVFAVDQDYGLAPLERRFTPTSAWALDAAGSNLPVIGRTGVTTRAYDVRLIETLAHDDGPEYHLGFTPLRDPGRNRLRELFVDGKTWLPEEAVVQGIGSRPPLTAVPWRVEFRRVDGATYIAQETALADLDYGKAGRLRWTTVRFEEFAAKTRLNAVMFGGGDPNAQREP